MNNEAMVFELRKRIFNEWRYKRYTWQEIKSKYGFSKKWFYKWLKRFLKYGEEGLKNKAQSRPPQPQSLSWDEKLKILDYIYDNPTHGPDRIAREIDFKISGKTVWKFLVKENLNTRRKRRLWAHYQGKPVLSEKEKLCILAKDRHIESTFPGQLVSIDTFMACVKDLGKIWQYTACDTHSSYGWAKVYHRKTTDETIDFLENHLIKNTPPGKIKRILTDQGSEFYSGRHKKHLEWLEEIYKDYNLKHTVTKVAHPWTNGYVERLQQTIWQEFYLCRLTQPYSSLEKLQEDLDKFMTEYNWKRRHTGYKLKDEGLEFPGHAFFDLRENTKIIEMVC